MLKINAANWIQKCITLMFITRVYISQHGHKSNLEKMNFFPLQPESEVETDERGFKLYDGQ